MKFKDKLGITVAPAGFIDTKYRCKPSLRHWELAGWPLESGILGVELQAGGYCVRKKPFVLDWIGIHSPQRKV